MERPASVTTFGILNIVFAGFGILGLLGTIAMASMTRASNNPVVRIMQENPAYAAWLKISIPLGLLACSVLLAAGIGLLALQSWGRNLTIGYAIYGIVFSLLSFGFNVIFLLRPMLEEASRKHGPEAAGAIGGAVGGTFGSCVGVAYPILLLIFMMRPNVKAAFQTPAAAQC